LLLLLLQLLQLVFGLRCGFESDVFTSSFSLSELHGIQENSGGRMFAHLYTQTDRQADNYATCCAVSPFWWRISSHQAAKAKGLLVVPRWPFCDWPTLVGGKAKQSGEAKEEKQ